MARQECRGRTERRSAPSNMKAATTLPACPPLLLLLAWSLVFQTASGNPAASALPVHTPACGVYAGYTVFRIRPLSLAQTEQMVHTLRSLDVLKGRLTPDLWSEAMMSPADARLFMTDPAFSLVERETIVPDVAAYLQERARELGREQQADRWRPARAKPTNEDVRDDIPLEDSFFDAYRSMADILDYAEYLATKYPQRVKIVPSIGKTWEDRDIFVVVLSGNLTQPLTPAQEKKRQVLFNAGQHAREWLAPSTVMYSLTNLLLHAEDEDVKPLLDSLEFHFIPLVNPDGYEYTKTSRWRMWRKNRRPLGDGIYGVDTNRNWGLAYGAGSASNDPSSETYSGPHAFSEKETQSVANYVRANRFRLHVDFHTYGGDILRRWASSKDKCIDDSVMKAAGDAARDAIVAAGGNRYRSASGDVLGIDGGCMPDWTYSAEGMISYTIELSDGGFVLPASEIRPVGKEGYAAIKALAKFVADGNADSSKMQWTNPNSTTTTTTTTTTTNTTSDDNYYYYWATSGITTVDMVLMVGAIFALISVGLAIVLVVAHFKGIIERRGGVLPSYMIVGNDSEADEEEEQRLRSDALDGDDDEEEEEDEEYASTLLRDQRNKTNPSPETDARPRAGRG